MIDEPLVRALAHKEAVAFVGSGASIPSGLPDWRKFLENMMDYAEGLPGTDWSRTRQLLKEGDFLLAAEMLQRELPIPTFTRFIEDTFGKPGLEPNELHRSIARLPFSLAVTTNIDCLLEAAYRNPSVCTWRDPDAVFNAIRSQRFTIVKLHGSVSDPLSARLTRTHYRDGTLTNPEFNECIKDLLTWKTFLFIGYSLRDSDLLYLIDEARLRFGRKFGPHFAIMPKHEADPKFQAYLRDALSIETIEYERDQDKPGDATVKVVEILKRLAGRVSKESYGDYGIGLGLNDLSITRNEVVQAVLDRAAPMTGSMRGDVCMIQDDIYPKLSPVSIFPRRREMPLPEAIVQDSIVESVFLQAAKDSAKDYVYVKDVSRARDDLREMGYTHADYEVCDTGVKSELACPIIADGRRVGTLNFESDLLDAYTLDHIEVATRIASEFGRIYLQSEQRRRTAAPIEDYDQHPEQFAELMSKSRLVKSLGHDFLLYVIDYENRKLKANHPLGRIEYTFDEKSFAYKAFSTRSPQEVENAQDEVKKKDGWLNSKGVDTFKIRGPVAAFPVRAAGQTEAVMVTWMKDPLVLAGEKHPLNWFRASSRQAQRLANLLANDIFRPGSSRVESFLNGMYDSLAPIDDGTVWTKARLNDPQFCQGILDGLAAAAILPACGLKRVRIWRATRFSAPGEPSAFRIIKWLTSPDVQDQPQEKYVTGRDVPVADDVFSRYTLSRFRHDPFAKWQHPAMFPQGVDPRADELDKDPKGSWIVAPIVKIVRGGEPALNGFVSADMHVPIDGKPRDQRSDDSREIALQCRALDVISDLAQYVLPVIEQAEPKSMRAAAGKRSS